MRIAIIADTHLPRGRRELPSACLSRLAGADLIIHAGDFVALSVLAELESLGPPVLAVHGNVDCHELRQRLPARRIVEAGGVRFGLIHDAGPSAGRLERLRLCFPEARAVVFGHSHVPLHERDADFDIFNPGSPTDRRRQPAHTMGMAHLAAPGQLRLEHVVLD